MVAVYFLPLVQYVNNFASYPLSLFSFLFTYKKSIQLLCDYIVVTVSAGVV